MTQALALYDMLKANGHEVGHVFLGVSARRAIPSYFMEKMGCPITKLSSPNFVTDDQNKSIRLLPTILVNLWKSPRHLKGLSIIHKVVKNYQPDLIINFYDLLGGLYNFYYRPKAKIVAVAHQFLANHPDFKFADFSWLDTLAYKALNFFTGYRTDLLLALSFRPYSPHKGLAIVPPLLRPKVKELLPVKGNYIHGYLLNDGYSEEVMQWHQQHPETPLQFFWDKKGETKERKIDETLSFHPINDEQFLEKMAGCKAFVSTAGFESICEAMYLGKPLMMVPVEGHFEQACNAIDAVDSGAGISATSFDLSKLVEYIPNHKPIEKSFRSWADQSESMIMKELESLIEAKASRKSIPH